MYIYIYIDMDIDRSYLPVHSLLCSFFLICILAYIYLKPTKDKLLI